jgi:hypothetical protein
MKAPIVTGHVSTGYYRHPIGEIMTDGQMVFLWIVIGLVAVYGLWREYRRKK